MRTAEQEHVRVEGKSLPAEPRSSIYDVAMLAGVSIKTVSRVVNGEPNVSAETRGKVLDAVGHLHYRPSAEARKLAANKLPSVPALHPAGRRTPLAVHEAGAGSRLYTELLELADLRRRRILTKSEFEAQKSKLLSR